MVFRELNIIMSHSGGGGAPAMAHSCLGHRQQSMPDSPPWPVSQKLSYHLSLHYPSDIRAVAERADEVLWSMLEAATQLHVPRQDEGKGVECVLAPPVASMSRLSFQELLVRLPVRRGGLGLRSCVDTSPAAFVGSVEMSLLHSAREVYSRRSPDNHAFHRGPSPDITPQPATGARVKSRIADPS